MRVVNVVLGLGVVCLALPALATGCSSKDTTTAQPPGTTCDPASLIAEGKEPASCAAVKSDCLALEDNTGKMTGINLRMSQLTLTKPTALLNPATKKLIANAVLPLLPDCYVNGQGTFNWLLQFDFTTGLLKTGGAKPVADPHSGYCFVDEMVTQNGKTFALAPVMLDALKAPGSFDVMMPQDLNVPIYLDANATSVVILPLEKTRLRGTVLSKDGNCIGAYNGSEFTTGNECFPDDSATPPQTYYTDGGSLDGYITLEQADGVTVAALGESLCVLLGNMLPAISGPPDANKYVKCKRDANNKIILAGDWCSSTDSAGGCADSFQLGATFAAAGIKINDSCP